MRKNQGVKERNYLECIFDNDCISPEENAINGVEQLPGDISGSEVNMRVPSRRKSIRYEEI